MILESKKQDILFILLPGFIGVILSILTQDIIQGGISAILISRVFQFVDDGHVFTTLFRTYFKTKTYKNYLYLIYPIVLWGGLSGLIYFDYMLALYLLVYMELFHYVRQNQGFMKIYAKKEKTSATLTNIFLIIISSLSLIGLHLNPSTNILFGSAADRYFLINNPPIFYWVNILVITAFCFWLVFEMFLFYKRENGLFKFLFALNINLLYIYCCFYATSSLTFLFPLILSHGVPYMALIYKAEGRLTNRNPLMSAFLIALTAIVGASLFDFSIDFKLLSSQYKLQTALLGGFLYTPFLFHYITDGWLWTSGNPETKKILQEVKKC